MIDGVDVSSHQATTPSLAGYSFLIARAAYGTDGDSRFRAHVGAARRAGLVTGAYLFLLPGRLAPIRDQVAALLEAIAAAGGVELVAIDREAERSHEAPSLGQTREAVERVQSTGRPAGLYASTAFYPADSCGADWRWVADYRPLAEPPIPWDVWQWTSSAGGLRLDRNRYRGTVDELRRLGRREEASGMARFVNAGGAGASSSRRLSVPAGTAWRYLDGSPGGRFGSAATVVELGRIDAHTDEHLVQITTALPYGDGLGRDTLVSVVGGTLVDAPPADSPAIDLAAELDAAAERAAAAVRAR